MGDSQYRRSRDRFLIPGFSMITLSDEWYLTALSVLSTSFLFFVEQVVVIHAFIDFVCYQKGKKL